MQRRGVEDSFGVLSFRNIFAQLFFAIILWRGFDAERRLSQKYGSDCFIQRPPCPCNQRLKARRVRIEKEHRYELLANILLLVICDFATKSSKQNVVQKVQLLPIGEKEFCGD